jgi:DNA polymerase-3 subunit delta
MKLQDFRSCLTALQPGGTYLLWGNEAFLIDKIIARLKKLIFGTDEAAATTNCVILYARDCPAAEAVAVASTHPFFGKKSLVVVHNIQEFPKPDESVLKDYLSHQTPAAVLVLTDTTQRPYRATSHPAVPKDKARLIDVNSPPDWEFEKWVRALLSKDKKGITPGAMESLRENVGNNITNLAMEIEKLVCLAGDQPEINETHTEALLGRSRTETEYVLADAVASRDRSLALTLLADLLREGSRIPKVMAILRSQFEKIWRGKEMLQQGASGEDIQRELRIPKSHVPKFIQLAGALRVADLRRALQLIMGADLRMRTQKLDERAVVEMLLLQLCERQEIAH